MAYGTINAEQLTTQSGYTLGAGNASSFKNRIINGAMVIDQRNGGASVTPTATNTYTLDRWVAQLGASSKYSVQQSSTAPAGFTNSLLVTSLAATAVGATDYYAVRQIIEGFNVADLAWGTASAKPVVLSFQVYSSLTGTFGGVISNNAENRSYPFTYTISSANTWTSISVSIAGDTSGTWLTTNGVGIRVGFGLGVGSTYSGTAGAWASALYLSATGATSVVSTNGATFYITGVQLEVGTVATSFDYRSYGTELMLCQRYFEKSYDIGSAVGTNTAQGRTIAPSAAYTTTSFNATSQIPYKVTKRNATTSITFYAQNGTINTWSWTLSGATSTSFTPSLNNYGEFGFEAAGPTAGLTVGTTYYLFGHWAASAEL